MSFRTCIIFFCEGCVLYIFLLDCLSFCYASIRLSEFCGREITQLPKPVFIRRMRTMLVIVVNLSRAAPAPLLLTAWSSQGAFPSISFQGHQSLRHLVKIRKGTPLWGWHHPALRAPDLESRHWVSDLIIALLVCPHTGHHLPAPLFIAMLQHLIFINPRKKVLLLSPFQVTSPKPHSKLVMNLESMINHCVALHLHARLQSFFLIFIYLGAPGVSCGTSFIFVAAFEIFSCSL